MTVQIECKVCRENEQRLAGGTSARQLVDKLWSFCNVLRDDGVGTIDYTDQLTYLLFLKMAEERAKNPLKPEKIVPDSCSWQRLLDADGAELERTYNEILETLSKETGVLGTIYRKAQNKIQDPAKLKRLIVELIDKENWSGTGVDIKGDAYEALLAKGAEDMKSGAGQYFTPRPLIAAMADCLQLTPEDTVHDPAVGSGGFLLSAYEHVAHLTNLTPKQRTHLQTRFVSGTELSNGPARLASMNMVLHGMVSPNGQSPIELRDSLTADPGTRYSVVMANPPFGTKSSNVVIGTGGKMTKSDLEITRNDFWVSTSNKQLNFVQHINTILEINGRAAVVLPDNVLFEGGSGEAIRKRWLKEFEVHTILRLPTGIFYAGGVKANVVFFEKRQASSDPWTKDLWVYDLRTNMHFTQKTKTMRRTDLEEFVQAFKAGARNQRVETERFKKFTYEEIISRDKTNLDIFWLKDDSIIDAADLPAPDIIAQEIADSLQSALNEIQAILDGLQDGSSEDDEEDEND
jgi:type I restriction enzyme M protein